MKKRFSIGKSTRAQVWVETVIYTLIGLTVIGLLLGVSMPVLQEQRDRALIEQAISSLNKIDERVYDTLAGTGNKRKMDLKIGKGQVIINAPEDKIEWVLESRYQFSEANTEITAGKVKFITLPKSPWEVRLTLEMPFDITYGYRPPLEPSLPDAQPENDGEQLKQFSEASLPHSITIENLGIPEGATDARTIINFDEV